MAIIKLGALVVGIRGTIGGVTFSESLAGPYARVWTSGVNPRTNLQSEQRRFWSLLHSDWDDITQGQRDDWDTWAALVAQKQTNPLGEDYYLSGYQWFLKCNARLLHAALAIIEDPPANPYPTQPTINSIAFEDLAPGLKVEIAFDADEFEGHSAIIHASVTQNAPRSVQHTNWYWIFTENAVGALVTELEFTNEYEDRYIAPYPGTRLFLRVYTQSDEGLRSAAWTDYATYPTP